MNMVTKLLLLLITLLAVIPLINGADKRNDITESKSRNINSNWFNKQKKIKKVLVAE